MHGERNAQRGIFIQECASTGARATTRGAFEDPPAGSSDAGWLGLPFTQVEDEEEWMGFLDWDAVVASAGQSSS